MPRANRYRLGGYVWHLTERCHRKQFMLRFARDRRAWIRWLYEARKRYGLSVLNFQVTSNHLLVHDRGEGEIAQSMQLVAGCVGRAYNRRKGRPGAFWEDSYHATAVDSDEYLARCFTYIDLNMVRAGVVEHPRQWPHAGYHEIQQPPRRYRIIDREALCDLLGTSDDRLAALQNEWIEQRWRGAEPNESRSGAKRLPSGGARLSSESRPSSVSGPFTGKSTRSMGRRCSATLRHHTGLV